MTVSALADQAQALLDAATAGLALATTTTDAPSHRFRSHGLPNLELCCDDGELAVWLERVEHRETTPESVGGCTVENYFHWVIGLYRCWPSGDTVSPSAADYDEAAADLLVDAWAILTEFYDRIRSGALLSGCGCEDVALGDLAPSEVEPSGGCAGWEFRLTFGAACLTDTGS